MSGKYNRPLTEKERRKKRRDIRNYKKKRELFLEGAILIAPRCWYCGCRLTRSEATVDHIVPRSRGGISAFINFALCCLSCNTTKADRTLDMLGWDLKEKPDLSLKAQKEKRKAMYSQWMRSTRAIR